MRRKLYEYLELIDSVDNVSRDVENLVRRLRGSKAVCSAMRLTVPHNGPMRRY